MKILSFSIKSLSYNVILSYFGFGHFFQCRYLTFIMGKTGWKRRTKSKQTEPWIPSCRQNISSIIFSPKD